MIHVLLADDHSLFRKGLRNMLEIEDDIRVIGEARNGFEARELVRELSPDVVLLDINMPRLDGIATARELRREHPDLGLIMLTMFAEEEFVERALAAGANGYLLKDAPFERVVEAIRATARGGTIAGPDVYVRGAGSLPQPPSEPAGAPSAGGAGAGPGLGEDDAALLRLVVAGLTDREIAHRLGLGEGAVRERLAALFRTLGVADRTQAAIYALSRGLVPTT